MTWTTHPNNAHDLLQFPDLFCIHLKGVRNYYTETMFAFAKQLVKSAEGIINNPQGEGHNGAGDHHARGLYGSGGVPSHGFRVLHVAEGSPGSRAGVESLFDFVIGINGHEIVGQQQQQQQQQYFQQPATTQYPPFDPNEHSTPESEYAQSGSPFYTSPPPQQSNPYAPAVPSNYSSENPRVHHRSSLSFSSVSQIVPQLVPPHAEVSPLEPFIAEVASCRGRSISLDVWSSKGRVRRTLVIPVPAAEYGTEPNGSLGIGLSLQWSPLSIADHIWHVLNVAQNSPAEKAGLISHSDYIVGAENGLLENGGEHLLGAVVQKLVSDSKQQQSDGTAVGSQPELELFVYNSEYDSLRAVRIRPNSSWGGSGLLGCGVGYGLLHRLPAKYPQDSADAFSQQQIAPQSRRQPSGAHFTGGIPEEEEPVYPGAASSSNYFTPATMGQQAPPLGPPPPAANVASPPPPPPTGAAPLGSQLPPQRKKKHHHYPTVGSTLPHHQSAASDSKVNNDLAAYFAEEEQRSKELDGYVKHPNDPSLPPPPPPPTSN